MQFDKFSRMQSLNEKTYTVIITEGTSHRKDGSLRKCEHNDIELFVSVQVHHEYARK